MSPPNEAQQSFWNEQAGPVWVQQQARLDAQMLAHGDLLLERLALKPGERVLDVGCGCGGTSLEIARQVGDGGAVVGVDLSGPMLERARERALQAGVHQLRFEQADAQTATHEGPFDVVHSRFGVMFFDDPVGAFRNLRAALRPGGRLGFICWRRPPDNPWVMVPMAAVASLLEMPPPAAPGTPGMFGFADGDRVRSILEDAGLGAVSVEPVDLPMKMGGGSPAEAADFFLEVGPVAGLLREQQASEARRAEVREAVRGALEAHAAEGVLALGSGVWLATASA